MSREREIALYEQLRQYAGKDDRAEFVWCLDYLKLSLREAAERAGFSPKEGSKTANRKWCQRARRAFEEMRHGDRPPVASRNEVLRVLTDEMRSGSGSSRIQAAIKLAELKAKRGGDRPRDMASLATTLVSRHGRDKALTVWECLGLPMSEFPAEEVANVG